MIMASKKIQIDNLTIQEETQHTVVSDNGQIVVRRKSAEVQTQFGRNHTYIYEVDFHAESSLEIEDSDLNFTFAQRNFKKMMTVLMQDPEIRRMIVEYLKENP